MEKLQIELVNVVDKKVVTTSLKVAEMFGKEHKHVGGHCKETNDHTFFRKVQLFFNFQRDTVCIQAIIPKFDRFNIKAFAK